MQYNTEIVKWVSKSMHLLSIVEDEGFHILMKTGRLEYYIPSPRTVAQDVNQVFKKTSVTKSQNALDK
jgi:hypothetical protein